MGFIEIVDEEERFELRMEDTVFQLRRLSAEIYNDIVKRHTRRSGRDRQGRWIEERNEEEIDRALLDYVIVGWKGVVHPVSKKEIECSRDMKMRLPGSVRLEILEATDARNIGGKERAEDEAKN